MRHSRIDALAAIAHPSRAGLEAWLERPPPGGTIGISRIDVSSRFICARGAVLPNR